VDLCFKLIILVQILEVVFNLLIDLFDEGIDLTFREVPAPTVYGFELAAVDGDGFSAEKIAFPAEKGKERQIFWIALWLSRRKSAIVLKSGVSRRISHINSTLRFTSFSSLRLERTRLR
jgi:hypothetical protein